MVKSIIKDAKKLGAIPGDIAGVYYDRIENLIEQVNQRLDEHPGISDLIGGNPLEMMHDNHNYHARFMSNIFKLNNFELLARTVPWVYRAYHSRGFSYDYFFLELHTWKQVITDNIGAEKAKPILEVYSWMIDSHKDMIKVSLTEKRQSMDVLADAVWLEKARGFLSAILDGDTKKSVTLADGWGRWTPLIGQPEAQNKL